MSAPIGVDVPYRGETRMKSRASTALEPPAIPTSGEQALRNIRILIADESEFIRQKMKSALLNQPNLHLIAEAGSGAELLAKSADLKPQIVILDMALPTFGGLEILRKLQESSPDTKLIVLSLNEGEEMIAASMEAGVRGYVMKYDFQRKLVAAVWAAWSGLRFFDRRILEILLKRNSKGSANKGEMPLVPLPITTRELEVVRLVARGQSNRQIAAQLGISKRTTETHRANFMRKFNLHTLAELIYFALANRLIDIDSLPAIPDSSFYSSPLPPERPLGVANLK